MNIAGFLLDSARAFGDHPAITWRGAVTSYAQLNDRCAALAAAWRGRGIGRGDRIALLMDNRPELLEAMFSAFRIGAVVVPCNARSTASEVAFVADDCAASLVVTDAAHAEVARAASVDVLIAGDEYESARASGVADADPWAVAEVDPGDTAWIFYTSGTTGRPKGAMLSHGALTFVTVGWLADLTPLSEHDVTLHAAPLSHGAGFHALAATARGASQVIAESASFDPVAILRVIHDEHVTNTWLVPTQIIRLTDAAAGSTDVPSLAYVVYGGAPMAPAAMQRALDTFGPVFVQLYGQGETPMTATVLRREDHRPELLGSAGRVRAGIELRVVDAQDRTLAPGEVGEVVVRGPSLMTGYWQRPDATAETLRNGWLHTGDLGTMSPDGVLRLLDRTKDMIISGGSNVYAVEVEAVLATHPSVADVAVIGVPDEVWGERVVAVVVAADGAEVDAAALDALCRADLAGYKAPRAYHVLEALPRNAYGKVLKSELRDRFAQS